MDKMTSKKRLTAEEKSKLLKAAAAARERCSKRNATRSSLHGLVGRQVCHHSKIPKYFKDGEWSYETEDRVVILMAMAEGYAIVRRPRCAPYLVREAELSPNDQDQVPRAGSGALTTNPTKE